MLVCGAIVFAVSTLGMVTAPAYETIKVAAERTSDNASARDGWDNATEPISSADAEAKAYYLLHGVWPAWYSGYYCVNGWQWGYSAC